MLYKVHDIRILQEGELKAIDPFDEIAEGGKRGMHCLAVPMRLEALLQNELAQSPWGKSVKRVTLSPMPDAKHLRQKPGAVSCVAAIPYPRCAEDREIASGPSYDDALIAQDRCPFGSEEVGEGGFPSP